MMRSATSGVSYQCTTTVLLMDEPAVPAGKPNIAYVNTVLSGSAPLSGLTESRLPAMAAWITQQRLYLAVHGCKTYLNLNLNG
jgi:hypothetical protein